MSDKKYNFVHNDHKSKDFSRPSTTVRTAFKRFPKTGEFAEVHVNGHRASRRSIKSARERAIHFLKTTPVGTNIVVEVFDDKDANTRIDQARFLQTLSVPPVKDGPGVIGIDRFASHVELMYPNARWAGTCVCKPDSDHRDCAAIDYFDTPENMERMRDDAIRSADYFNTKYVILYRTIYMAPSFNGSYYGGDYHAHVHVSVYGGVSDSACYGDREVHG